MAPEISLKVSLVLMGFLIFWGMKTHLFEKDVKQRWMQLSNMVLQTPRKTKLSEGFRSYVKKAFLLTKSASKRLK